MTYKYNPYRDTFEHVDDEDPIYAYGAIPDTSKSWIVNQVELTDECIERIADAVARKIRGEEDAKEEF